jgi:predicted transcriptional regulator
MEHKLLDWTLKVRLADDIKKRMQQCAMQSTSKPLSKE